MKKFLIVIFVYLTIFSLGTKAEIINPGFELAEVQLENEDFSRPTSWENYNFATVTSSFQANPEHGQTSLLNWLVPDTIITPHSGNSCLVLSTGDIGEDDSLHYWAAASQQVEIIAGQTLEFYYFFGTFDYPSFSDVANLLLYSSDANISGPEPNLDRDNIKKIQLASVDSVGAYSSTDGWLKVEYTFTAEDAANYDTIAFRVEDVKDSIYKSYLAIDDVAITPEPLTVCLLALGGLMIRKKV